MGNGKSKNAVEPSAQTIAPWMLYAEPSESDEKLMRLCVTHQKSDRFKILETYYPDEIDSALALATLAVHSRKHMLTMHMLQPSGLSCKLLRLLCPMILKSRSTDEFRESCIGPSVIVSTLGGVRKF